jgi:hypothetical protein
MTNDQWHLMLRRLERRARREPAAVRRRAVAVLGLAALPFLCPVAAVATAAVAGVFALLRSFEVPAGVGGVAPYAVAAVAVGLARLALALPYLREDVTAPEGVRLDRRRAPALFAEVESIRRTLGAPRIHEIVLTHAFNASVARAPRHGRRFGRLRNHLDIGLPLMQTLSAMEFRAILAHEVAHLCSRTGRTRLWLKLVDCAWGRLATLFGPVTAARPALIADLAEPIRARLAVYAFVLRRQDEYAADAIAARFLGAQVVADALVSSRITSDNVEQHLCAELEARAADEPEPVARPLASLPEALRQAAVPEAAAARLIDLAEESTGDEDSHPSLRDRLAALGVEARMTPVPNAAASNLTAPGVTAFNVTAAERFLGAALDDLTAEIDARLVAAIQPRWREIHDREQSARRRLWDLEAKAIGAELSATEARERVVLTARLRDEASACPLGRVAIAKFPDDPGLLHAMAQLLLPRGDSDGRACVDRAMATVFKLADFRVFAQLTEEITIPGCRLASATLDAQGDTQAALRYLGLHNLWQSTLARAHLERCYADPDDEFAEHGLDGPAVRGIVEQLAARPTVRRGYLVRKAVECFTERPHFVLALVSEPALSPNDFSGLVEDLELPGSALVVDLHRVPKLRAAIAGVRGAAIYDATDARIEHREDDAKYPITGGTPVPTSIVLAAVEDGPTLVPGAAPVCERQPREPVGPGVENDAVLSSPNRPCRIEAVPGNSGERRENSGELSC